MHSKQQGGRLQLKAECTVLRCLLSDRTDREEIPLQNSANRSGYQFHRKHYQDSAPKEFHEQPEQIPPLKLFLHHSD